MNTRTQQNAASRLERDALGELNLPHDAVYGIQTARALQNFPITGVSLSHFPDLVQALAMVKKAAGCCQTNANQSLQGQ